MKKIVSLFCVVLLLSACSKSSDPSPVVVEPAQKNVYFFSVTDATGDAPVTNIAAFTPDDSASTIITSAGTNFIQTIDTGNGVMYGENGMFYKASADKFGTITTQQLSFTTGNSKICGNINRYADDYKFFKKPGVDGLCGNGDDVGPFVVFAGMDNDNDLFKPNAYPLAPIELKTGFDGWLMFDKKTLSKANSKFTKSSLIATDFNSVKLIHTAPNHIVLDVDGQIRLYDKTSGVLSDNLHVVINGGIQHGISNDTTFFFNDGIAINSLLLDGSVTKSKTLFSEVVGEIINIRAIVGDLLIYTTIGAQTQHNRVLNESIHALTVNIPTNALTLIAGRTLVARDDVSTVMYTNVYGSRVYFNRLGGAGEASMILTDGTGLEVIPNSVWIGETLNNADGSSVPNQKIFLRTSLLDQANFNLISYDAMNYKVSSLLTTLPNVNNIGSLHVKGTAGLGVLVNNTGTSTDIFYVDTANKDSFFRVTENDNLTESLLQ